jgi:hypothetical protein
MIMIVWIIILFMEQAFNTPYPSIVSKYTSARETEGIIKSLKAKKLLWVQGDIHKGPKTKFSNNIHM